MYKFDILNKYNIDHCFYGVESDYSETRYDLEDTFYLKQSHTSNVAVLTSNDKVGDAKFIDCDGIITNLKGKKLVIRTADCQSIFLYDPVKKVIGNIHSGWKGTLNGIVINAINLMVSTYGINKEDIICCFNHFILSCHFEIAEDVYTMFKDKYPYIDTFVKEVKVVDGVNKYYLDLVKFNIDLLNRNGVKNTYESNICSYCDTTCYSYRRDKTTKRNGSVISL